MKYDNYGKNLSKQRNFFQKLLIGHVCDESFGTLIRTFETNVLSRCKHRALARELISVQDETESVGKFPALKKATPPISMLPENPALHLCV